MAGTDGGIPGKKLTRREFLHVDGLERLFNPTFPLDRAGIALQSRLNKFPDKKPHIVNSAVPRSLAGEAIFSLATPEPQGIGTVTNLLPTLGVDEELVQMIGLISKKIIAPIAFGLTGGYAGFQGGVALANRSLKSTSPPPVDSGQKDKGIKKKSKKYTRREAIFGGAGAVIGAGISEGLLACGWLTPDSQNFTNYDSLDYQRTTLVNQPLSETVSPPDIQRAPHATELIAELQRAIQIAKPDVSLYRTSVDYNYTRNVQTGNEFEMAFVKIGSQTDHIVVNGQERLLDEDIYMVSYIGPEGQPIARTAIWSEIPDQVGAKAFGLHLADINLLPDFKKPLLEYVKKDSEDKVRIGFFNPVTHEINDIARFTLNQPGEFSFLKALSIIFNPFEVQPVEAAELIPTATPGTTKPTIIATATATVILEPTRAASPVPMLEVGGLQIPDPKASNPELFDLTKPDSPIVQFANAFGVKPEEVGSLTPQLLTGIDGKQFVVMTTGDLTSTTNYDESGTPLLIAEQGENGKWEWSEATLKNVGEKEGILFGSMLTGWYVRDPNYMGQTFMAIPTQYFGMITSPDISWITGIEGGKYDLRQGLNQFNFKIPDYLLDYANRNKIPVQLMHVFWGDENTIPTWVKEINSKDEFFNIIDNHINTLLLHYNGKVDTYSLLNEYFGNPFNNDPTLEFWNKKVNSLGITNQEFVTHIFKVAHEDDPNARLVFNDYGMEIPGTTTYSSQKDQKNFELLQKALKNGAPIDAVGFQMHLYARDFLGDNFQNNVDSFRAQIQKYNSLGIEIDITELDIRLNEGLSNLTSEEKLILQARIYQEIIKVARQEGIDHITVWGISDRDSWLENTNVGGPNALESNPLLFNDSDNIKPAFFGALKGLLE